MTQRTTGPSTARAGPAPAGHEGGHGLPLSKLRGLAPGLRVALKQRGIATCARLLRAAGRAGDRRALARDAGVDPGALALLVRRADLARVAGVGAAFGAMLEELGVGDVASLAAQGPRELHARLARLNREERVARRSPTPEEVEGWVAQARALPALVTYEQAASPSPASSS